MEPVTYLPAHEQARMIGAGEISARDLLAATERRVEQFNPTLNAVIHMDLDAARTRAAEADAATARGESWGPLHGVPMTIKESFDIAGMPSTWGAPDLKDNIAASNCLVVDRLLAAGAILYGKTNVPLMLMDWQSFNAVYGTTNNPWDTGRTPGGSSGGAAAALATGMTALEVGSDIGASIRNPAHYCGVFGHKPTYGIVPYDGHALPGIVTAPDITVAGPLARSADDLALALDIIAGPGALEGVGWRLDLAPPAKTALADFKVGVMLTDPICVQDSELTDQLQATVDALAAAGVAVDERARPAFDTADAHRLYLTLLRAETHADLPEDVFEKHRAAAAERAADDLSYDALVDRAVTQFHRDWLKANEERNRMRLQWAAFFEDYDLMLCPVAASAAFPHDHEGERPDRTVPINGGRESVLDQLFWAGISGAFLLPGTVAPAGLTRSGLPCGLQIISSHGGDRTGIEFARLMERELGGFVPPPGYA